MMKYIRKFRLPIIITIVLILLLSPFLAHRLLMPVEFNQFMIQTAYYKYKVITPEEFFDMAVSMYSSGLNLIFNKKSKQPDFEDEIGMFEYIFSYIPPYAVVYPTEEFYYFAAIINGKEVAGNIRVADIGSGQGRMGMAYFNPEKKNYKIVDLTGIPGIKIKRKNDYLYRVSYRGKTVRFKIPDHIFDPPESMKALQEERFLGREHDEAGVRLLVFFNYKTNSFYFVHDDESGVAEEFIKIDDNLVVGRRTNFVYFIDKDYNRKILVSVNEEDTYANNFLDGPQDQVPFKIDIREFIHRYNPGNMLGKGIDEHGIDLGYEDWARIAISSFERHNSYQPIIQRTNNCLEQETENKSLLWTCLTKEYWNTPQWREAMKERLKEEGKSYPYD